MEIGDRIKQRRTEMKLSQRELSNRMGYHNHSTITKIEAGKVDIPQSRIVQFADVLNTSIAYLMGWEEKTEFNGMIEEFNGLNDEQKKIVADLVHSLAKRRTY